MLGTKVCIKYSLIPKWCESKIRIRIFFIRIRNPGLGIYERKKKVNKKLTTLSTKEKRARSRKKEVGQENTNSSKKAPKKKITRSRKTITAKKVTKKPRSWSRK